MKNKLFTASSLARKFFNLLWPTVLFAISSCEDQVIGPPLVAPIGNDRVAVLCEGNFMWGNAKLDIISTDSSGTKIWNNAYEAINNKPIGDVLQAGLLAGNNLFLSVNNSGKVIGLDPKTLQLKKSNVNLKSPRQLLLVNGNLWVSDLYANKITVLDTANLKTVKEISVHGWTETMVMWGGHVAVACYKGQVLLLDSMDMSIKKTLTVDTGALYLAVDASNQLWVGSSSKGKSAIAAFAMNSQVQVAYWTLFGDIGSLQVSRNKSTLFVSWKNRVYSFRSDAQSEINVSLLLDVGIKQLYGYLYDAKNNVFYLADAKDYVSSGEITRIPMDDPSKIKVMPCGVNPSGFVVLP